MIPVISFIGWHNSGKTTLAGRVVTLLKERGYRVAVIKATKETGIAFDTPNTDTARHRQAGADTVLLVAPDQMVMTCVPPERPLPLLELVRRYCFDLDIVIGEGFKGAEGVPKIEVRREAGQPLLCRQVRGVVALATDLDFPDDPGLALFRLDQGPEIAQFIVDSFQLEQARSG
jgi:molybdopterin-guanine dinucleotide biosynthesis protein B